MAAQLLVGVNGSPASDRAVQFAAQRAAARGLELRLLHVIDESVRSSRNAEVRERAQARADEILQQATDAAHKLAPNVPVHAEAVSGDPFRVFVELSQDVELLVVGSDSSGGERPVKRGVKSFRIAAAGHAPVAVIPDIDLAERRGVVVGVDGSDISNRALEFAASEADRRREPLIAVHAWTIPIVPGAEYSYSDAYFDDAERGAESTLSTALAEVQARYPGVELRPVVLNANPAHALTAEAENAAMVVVGSHGRGAFGRLLLGSVSHGVLAHMVAPTVIVRQVASESAENPA
ncbi:universal stress protein [Diaminobutyricimonas sp. LJ205]|uniref:universal stress protein n=1 Tax=Diaminobutyricimonas sp. LJ205 TaxID=2683590 RepID=UPI0012F4EF6C|nr:universal stress protein [Diaminobutyricimonas sp. LJ205]